MKKPKWKVLITAPYFQKVYHRYELKMKDMGLEPILPAVNERLSEADLLPLVTDVDGVISGDDQFSERVLDAAGQLKVISKWGTGVDSIDLKAASELGIAVRNTPGAFSEPVADTVFAFILMFARGLHLQDADIRAGNWEKRQCFALTGKTLGIVGVGDCGSAVAYRAGGFGLKLLGNDIREIDQEVIKDTGIRMANLDELLSTADFISMNCDLNPSSLRLMNSNKFALLKHEAYYITTCRGPVTVEAHLVEALRSGLIAGAGVDVFENEPLPPDSPLRKMKNVILTPHNANSDPATADRIHESTLAHLIEELEKSG